MTMSLFSGNPLGLRGARQHTNSYVAGCGHTCFANYFFRWIIRVDVCMCVRYDWSFEGLAVMKKMSFCGDVICTFTTCYFKFLSRFTWHSAMRKTYFINSNIPLILRLTNRIHTAKKEGEETTPAFLIYPGSYLSVWSKWSVPEGAILLASNWRRKVIFSLPLMVSAWLRLLYF